MIAAFEWMASLKSEHKGTHNGIPSQAQRCSCLMKPFLLLPVCAANSSLCPPSMRGECGLLCADRFQKRQKISWSSAMDHAQGNHLTHNGKAPEEDKQQGEWGVGGISLGFLHWHEMTASLPSASSNPSCWHYTSCTVDPPPCCRLPSWIISCVTAVVTELLARQTWKHHFNA